MSLYLPILILISLAPRIIFDNFFRQPPPLHFLAATCYLLWLAISLSLVPRRRHTIEREAASLLIGYDSFIGTRTSLVPFHRAKQISSHENKKEPMRLKPASLHQYRFHVSATLMIAAFATTLSPVSISETFDILPGSASSPKLLLKRIFTYHLILIFIFN
jgi:hypothetical protein